MATMTAERLAELIRERGLRFMGETVGDFGKQVAPAIREGWDLIDWGVTQAGGAALFVRKSDSTLPSVLVLNAPEDERPTWETRLATWTAEGSIAGNTIVIMQEQ